MAVPELAAAVLAVARQRPDDVAVTDRGRHYRYRDLDAVSAAVAGKLRYHGIRPGDAVAVCLPRSWSLVVAMLGIRRLGATVVPLDSASPPDRQRHILADSASVALVGDGPSPPAADGVSYLAVADLLAGTGPGSAGTGPGPGETSPERAGTAAAPVSFVFYTSGTTGRPKGVEVLDAGLLRLASPGYITLTPGARYACLSNPAFDAISFEVWTPLLTGGSCVILDEETVATPHLLARALGRERIDAMFVTAALFNAVAEAVPDCFASVGQVLVGGEQLNAGLIRRWYARNPASATQLYNGYGPTEATTFALAYPIPRDFAADVVPIGRPLPGTVALLVAAGSRVAAAGEVAELHLGGAAVAAGYRGQPEETARRFVRLPWHDGGADRYYRTGDLVRQDAAGRIEYLGRADRQVKVRGFRIEPEEVERQLAAHPAILAAYVGTRTDPLGGPRELLGYLVTDGRLSYAELDRHLVATLPAYMRPHRIYLVGELPRTANGKVDGDALLAGGGEPCRPESAGQAATTWQREVLALVSDVLGGGRPRLNETLITAGGDSLAALRLRFAIRQRWGCDLDQAVVLRSDLAALAEAITAARPAGRSRYPAPAAPTGARSAPATSEQQRLWLLQQQEPGSAAYNVGFAFRLTGAVDESALRAAVTGLVKSYPAVRTAFRLEPDGLRQHVADPYDPWIEASAIPGGSADWEEVARRLGAAPFDLSSARLLEACWCPDPAGGVLLLRMHHIAVDGWSVTVLLRELSARYAGTAKSGPERPAPLTPLDYAAWQANWLGWPEYARHRAELRDHYASADTDTEPLEPHQGPVVGPVAGPVPAAGFAVTRFDDAQVAALDRLGVRFGLTRFELLLTAFSWSVYGVTGRTRPRIASPVAGRPVPEFEPSVGMFANTVLVPLRLAAGERLGALLPDQAQDIRAVLDRQDVILADVVADHDFRTGGPLFDFLFVLDNADFGALILPGCEVSPVWLAPAGVKCPLTLAVTERADGLDCLWEYDPRYLDADAVQALAALLAGALDAVATDPGQTLAELVTPYRAGRPDPGRGAEPRLEYLTVADGFARQLSRAPDAIALADGARKVSYAELDCYAAALAAELAARYPLPPVGQPGHVALRLEPSVEHVAALLALARLNLTAVPLDPAYPPALLDQVLGQVKPVCVLVPPTAVPDAEDEVPHHPVVLRAQAGPPAGTSLTAEPRPEGARRPLYTLFTSGSTGPPKGVSVPDLTLCNLLQWQAEAGGLPSGAVTQQFSMLSFDVSFQEIFGTLCGGGTLHLIRPGWRHDLPALLGQLENAGIERIHLPYVALQLLAEHGRRLGRFPSRLRDVVTAGEQLLCTDAVRAWFAGLPGARLFNHYGPTETHVVSALRLDGDPAVWPDRPAIGGPVAGTWLRVVDEAGLPVPPGCPGELLIGGLQAVPCYLGSADLNASRFIRLDGDGLFYRSGDQARFDRDGLLHYLGRRDEQVKVSGHRVELGQLEAALASHPAVIVAAVVHRAGQLIACAEFLGDPPDPAELAAHLADRLPTYLRVDRFRQVTTLPTTASGKLDRRRILDVPGTDLGPRPSRPGPSQDLSRSELTAREAELSALFESVIGRPIEPDQRFFDAGASSLGLMRFHLRATTELGLTLTIADLFEHVTIRELARFLARGQAGAERVADRGRLTVGAAAPPIAIIGLAVRLPGAPDLAGFWDLVTRAGSGISYFDAAGGLVGARSQLPGPLAFDPYHFGISRADARLMDPQQRHLLMASVQALAHAGLADPGRRRTGIVASCGENTYFQATLRDGAADSLPDSFALALHHDKDFLATKVSYYLGLTGPAFTVQAACASSLVAVHVAAGMLRQGDAEVMLAAGVLIDPQLAGGYRYRPQHIFSRDGHCRPFSDDASGTIGGSGVGVVVLKPLALARRDGDTVYAVVTGSALNNDGSGKLSYSAPSLAGQREVITAALRRSGRTAADLGYIEAHGTGTELGDPVEVSALRQALGPDVAPGQIALSSVKSQIGHLGAAAGVAGLIRATLAVYHGQIPPNVDFRRLNPKIGADAEPFTIPSRALPWPPGRPRVAGVSSFGIGGTNGHLLIEAAEPAPLPVAAGSSPSRAELVPCLMLSATSVTALRADAGQIAAYLRGRPSSYPQVLRHLQAGRPVRRFRVAAACVEVGTAVEWLAGIADGRSELEPVIATGEELAWDAAGAGGSGAGGFGAGDLGAGGEGAGAEGVARAWLSGVTIRWADGPAQPPWDFPPPSFALADYDFVRAGAGAAAGADAGGELGGGAWPARVAESEWLHQPQWVRSHRAAGPSVRPGPSTRFSTAGVRVLVSAEALEPALLGPLAAGGGRLLTVVAAAEFAQVGPDAYRVDPADADSLGQLLDAIGGLTVERGGGAGIDWLHALPLSVDGAVGPDSVARARWACLDTPAALARALGERPAMAAMRVWWLSHQAQPVDGPVRRPELGLLAGITEVGPQESAIDGRWLDLPGADPSIWAAAVAGLLTADTAGVAGADATRLPGRLALAAGYWWRQATLPVAAPLDDPAGIGAAPLVEPGVHVVLGGTGGIGATLAAWLLEHVGGTVILVARKPQRPAELARWADRVDIVAADLATEATDVIADRIAQAAARRTLADPPGHDGTTTIVTVVHAAGTAAGGLITRRDPVLASHATAAKLNGALLAERLIGQHRPPLALYCSSMSAQLGGAGQLDYAAANGALDGFARYRGGEDEPTLRLCIDWDVWREVGMASAALGSNPRHQAHLATGLTVAEASRVLARAVRLQLPHLLVSTTDLAQAVAFYAPASRPARPLGSAPPDQGRSAALDGLACQPSDSAPGPQLAEHLSGRLCRWLGLDWLDPTVSLYELGADSLTLVELIAEIRDHTGEDLLLSALSHQVSLADVLALLHGGTEPAESGIALVPGGAVSGPGRAALDPGEVASAAGGVAPVTVQVWQRGTEPTVLCLLHPVGGDVLAYRPLVAALDDRLTVGLIADPALAGPAVAGTALSGPALTRSGPPGWSIADRAWHYYAALRAQFPPGQWRWRLAGWSFGAWVAVAIAAQAEADGCPAEEVSLIDPPSPDAGSSLAGYDDAQLERVFAAELGHGAADRIGPPARDYAERLARCGRASLASMAGYSPPALDVTPARLWLAAQGTPGLPAPEPAPTRAQAWQTLLPGLVSWQALDTTHDGIVRPPCVHTIAAEISAVPQPVLWVG